MIECSCGGIYRHKITGWKPKVLNVKCKWCGKVEIINFIGDSGD